MHNDSAECIGVALKLSICKVKEWDHYHGLAMLVGGNRQVQGLGRSIESKKEVSLPMSTAGLD